MKSSNASRMLSRTGTRAVARGLAQSARASLWVALLGTLISLALGACSKTPPSPTGSSSAQRFKKRPGPGFRLSNASPESLPAKTVVAGEPLSDADAAKLLARLPKAPDEPLAVASARRPPSLPAPRPGRTIDEPFPPAAKAPPAPTAANAAEPLRVTRRAPEGDVAIAPSITVSFSEPMVELTTVGALLDKQPPLLIEPKPEGEFRWLGTQTVVFKPTRELPKATQYSVQTAPDLQSITGKRLATPERFTLRTLPPVLIGSYPSGGSVELEPVMLLLFDQAVRPDAVLQKLHATAKGQRLTLRLATAAEVARDETVAQMIRQSDERGPARAVALMADAPLLADAPIQVDVPIGTPSAEGPLTTEREQRLQFSTFAPLRMTGNSQCGEGCAPNAGFSIYFNNGLDEDAFDESLVEVSPAGRNVKVRAGGSGLSVMGAWKPGSYTVKVRAGLRDVHGQSLEKDVSVDFKVKAFDPALLAEQRDMVVQDPGAAPRHVVRHYGELDLDVRLYRVSPEQWGDYLRYRHLWDTEGREGAPPGTLVKQDTRHVVSPVDEMGETPIDLAPALEGGLGHVLVIVEWKKPYKERWERRWNRVWVQNTRLGLSAFPDARGGSLILVNTLSGSKPVAQATVSVPPLGVSATTDAQGLARLEPIRGPMAELGGRVRALVARSANDSTFVPGMFGANELSSSELRLFTFDDRQLYKPKETLRVKGLAREVGQLRGIDVSVSKSIAGQSLRYEVRDARNAQLGKGTVKFDDSGGFFLEFPLPDRANLGWASVSFEGALSGQHRFRIEEFRRPEFEATATTDTGPYVVGASGVATLTGKYYSGGGLAGAQVRWAATSIDASYAPPNNQDYRFGPGGSSWESDWGIEDSFGRGRARVRPSRSVSLESVTDATGQHRARVEFLGRGEPRPMTIQLNATLTDVNRQAWSTSTSMLVHPAKSYVGLRLKKPFVRAGDRVAVGVIATNIEGRREVGRQVNVTLRAVSGDYVRGRWTRTVEDVGNCQLTSADGEQGCELSVAKGGSYEVVAEVRDGEGRLNRTVVPFWALGPNVRVQESTRSALELTADKTTYAAGDTAELLVKLPFAPANGVLRIFSGTDAQDRPVHFDSELATVTVPISAADAPSVTVVLAVDGERTRLGPNGDPDESAPKVPAHASAVLSLSVPAVQYALKVDARPSSPEVRPGAKTSVTVDLRRQDGSPVEGEAAVIVVDESVLALAGYHLQDPHPFFASRASYGSGPINSRTAIAVEVVRAAAKSDPRGARNRHADEEFEPSKDLEDNVGTIGHGSGFRGGTGGAPGGMLGGAPVAAAPVAVAEAAPAQEAPRAAKAKTQNKPTDGFDGRFGDQLNGQPALAGYVGARSPVYLRQNFAALAVFKDRVKTDARGHAEVAFTLPDSTTRYRVMVIAWDRKDLFGSSESQLTARLPLSVRPSAPRFLNYGDDFALPIVVHNESAQAKRVKLVVRTRNATVKLLGKQVEVPPHDRVEVHFPSHTAMPGRARFDILGTTDDAEDAANVDLPVWTPGTTEAFATYGVIDDGAAAQKLAIPPGIDPGFGGLEISTASTALSALTEAMVYLYSYPYECNEQIASRLMSIAALRDVLTAFKAASLPAPEAMQARVVADLDLLVRRQGNDGGFGFWGSTKTWPYLTAHVGFALSIAKQKGYPVNPSMLARVSAYLEHIESHILEQKSDPALYRALRAYALFVLERLGQPRADKAVALIAEGGGVAATPLETLAWLLPTVSGAGKPEAKAILRHFENRAVETAGAAHFTTSYGESDYLVLSSEHRTDALILYGLLQVDSKNVLIPKVVSGLLGHRKQGHWANTHEDAFVLLALDSYFQKFEKVTPQFVARAWLGDELLQQHAYRGYSTDQAQTLVPMPDLIKHGVSDLIVGKEGQGRLYYRLGLRYAPSDMKLPPLDRGFIVTRRYEPIEGSGGGVQRDEQGVWHVRAGTTLRVRVSMVAESERHHVALVDPMPAGFEALNAALNGTAPTPPDLEAGGSAGGGRRGWYGWGRWYEHDNLRDERAEAFASRLWAGVYEYAYVVRATTPGNFVVPAAKAEEMYAPETFGRSASDRVIVE